MIEKIKVEDAIGQPLLHDITAIMPDGFKGVRFKRGHIVEADDIEDLKNIGKDHIYVGELEANEVHEEDAILELIPYLENDYINITGPAEGKISMKSSIDGVFVLNRPLLKSLNEIGDYTVVTKRSYTKVKVGDNLAGIRIVPLWTDRSKVDKAKEILSENDKLFEVLPYKKLKVGVIITGDEVYYGRIEDRFKPVLSEKLAEFDADVIDYIICRDDLDMLLEAYGRFKERGADLVIFTGGMSVDPDDLTPTAIKKTGAELIIQGIPMQPGNMLTIAKDKRRYLMGVPGATIHAPITSFDYFLPRIVADIDLKKEDFLEMAEGGLL